MRAAAVLFDSLGTLFEMESLRAKLGAIGLAPRELEVWLARVHRDGMALSTVGTFRTFREVARSALMTLIAELGQRPDPAKVEDALNGFSELVPFRDVKPALVQFSEVKTRRAILTNAGIETTQALLSRAGVLELIERIISVEEVRRWKPDPETFRHAAKVLQLEPKQIAFVSANPWEVQGAKVAGLYGVLLQRRGGHHQPAMPSPDLTVAGMAELVPLGAHYDPTA